MIRSGAVAPQQDERNQLSMNKQRGESAVNGGDSEGGDGGRELRRRKVEAVRVERERKDSPSDH